MIFRRIIFTSIIKYLFTAFILFSIVVSLCSGFADTVFYSRRIKAREEILLQADRNREELVIINYTPNLVTGIASFGMFISTSALAAMFLMKRFSGMTHALLILSTALAALVFLLPRPPIGTGTQEMREVFAFLMVLGLIDSIIFPKLLHADKRE